MNKMIFWLATGFCFFLFCLVVFFSNEFDWDHFFSFFEVEYRSWVLDKTPPLWTYQLCSGVSRLGDPQSFGLSPLFLPILLFGSFWGAKVLVIGSTLVGIYYLAKTLQFWLLIPTDQESPICYGLSLFFFLSGYFLWHFHVGHLTFVLFAWMMPAVYYLSKSRVQELSNKNLWILGVSSFCFLTAGFYHVAVFFIFPVLLSLGLIAIINILRFRRILLPSKEPIKVFGVLFLAILLSSYKWISVLKYQNLFPRHFEDVENHPIELAFSLPQVFMFHFSPTINYQFAWPLGDWGPWYIWEYASFSAIPFLLVLLGLFALSEKQNLKLFKKMKFLPELGIGFLVIVSLLLGDEHPLSLHRILNEYLFSNSLRSIGRYNLLLQAFFLLLIVRILSFYPALARKFSNTLIPIGLLLTMISLLTQFNIIRTEPLFEMLQMKKNYEAQMKKIQLVTPRDLPPAQSDFTIPPKSYMYRAVLLGKIVPNCYQPLNRPRVLSGEAAQAEGVTVSPSGEIPLISAPALGELSKPCTGSIYFLQNSFHIDRDLCPKNICINLNAINIYEDSGLAIDQTGWKYCLIKL